MLNGNKTAKKIKPVELQKTRLAATTAPTLSYSINVFFHYITLLSFKLLSLILNFLYGSIFYFFYPPLAFVIFYSLRHFIDIRTVDSVRSTLELQPKTGRQLG